MIRRSLLSRDTVRRYRRTLSWLVRDVVRHAPAAFATVLGASFVSVLSRAGALGVVILYVSAHANDRPIRRFGFELPADGAPSTLALWAGLGFAVSLLAAGSGFLASTVSFRIARGYVRRAVQRIFSGIVDPARLSVPTDLRPERLGVERSLNGLLLRDMTLLLRVVVLVLRLPVPLLTLLGAGAILIYLSPLLTAVVAVASMAYAVPLLVLNRRLVDFSRRRELLQPEAARGVNRIVRYLISNRRPSESSSDWVSAYLKGSRVGGALGALEGILLTGQKVDALRDVFQGVAILGALGAFSIFLAGGEGSWAGLLSYLAAFGYLTTSLGNVSRTATDLNRFLPQIQRYSEFLAANPPPAPGRSHERSSDAAIELVARPPILAGSLASVRLERGTVTFCLWESEPLRSDRLFAFCAALTRTDAEGAQTLTERVFFRGDRSELPPLRVRELAGLPDPEVGDASPRVWELLDAAGCRSEWEELGLTLETPIDPVLEERLSRTFRYLLTLLPGLLEPEAVFVLSWEGLETLPEAGRERILWLLGDRTVLLVGRRVPAALPSAVQATAVADETGVHGIGPPDWLEAAKGRPEGEAHGDGVRPAGEPDEAYDDALMG